MLLSPVSFCNVVDTIAAVQWTNAAEAASAVSLETRCRRGPPWYNILRGGIVNRIASGLMLTLQIRQRSAPVATDYQFRNTINCFKIMSARH
jgi:hypothetical protein